MALSLSCCWRTFLKTSSLDGPIGGEGEGDGPWGEAGLGEGDGEALCSGESRGDLLYWLDLVLGEVEGPRLKVSAFLGWLRFKGSGSESMGNGRGVALSCFEPGPSLLLGPVRRRKNWTSLPCWPNLARDSRGFSVASSCLSVSLRRWIRT